MIIVAKKKTKKTKIPVWRRVIQYIGAALLVVGIVVCFGGAGLLSTFLVEALNFNITDYQLNISSTVFVKDANGDFQPYEQLHGGDKRIWAEIDEIPQSMKNAAVAIEDERFYEHRGMDFQRTMSAIFNYTIHRDDSFGGSTITQQVIKNITNDKDTSIVRKLREIMRAMVLESQINDKQKILEFYLNIAYFGEGCSGVQYAALTYFDKNVSELNLAESASIIGITQSPTEFNPFEFPENNKEKQEVVLAKMLELNFITQEEHDKAVAQQLVFANGSARGETVQSYFTETMIDEVVRDLMDQKEMSEAAARQLIYSGGLKIYSTMNLDIQGKMQSVFEDSENTAIFPDLGREVIPQAAMVIIDQYTGELQGLMGGVGPKTGNLVLNRAAGYTRQPGSTIKPLAAYGSSLEHDELTPGSVLMDEAINLAGWKPLNWYSGFRGPVTVRQAIVQSMNIPAVKASQIEGPDAIFEFLRDKLRITTLVDQELVGDDIYSDRNLSALALGGLTHGITVLEWTAAYGPYASDGTYVTPHTYTKVLDANDNVLLEKNIIRDQVFSPQTAYLMTSMLKDTAVGPLGSPALLYGMTSAGKTGTTDDDRDRWYMGYTPYYVGGVWYGYDDHDVVPYYATSVVAHRIWREVMTLVHEDLPDKAFEKPDGITTATICTSSGLRAGSYCPAVTEEYKSSTVPSQYCSGYHASSGSSGSHDPEPTQTSSEPSATPTESATIAPQPVDPVTNPPTEAPPVATVPPTVVPDPTIEPPTDEPDPPVDDGDEPAA